ncbi:MAG: hypothetical protein OK457_11545 [Thaumarchaeota archaeon]|nr:hypothetical protein [Nitrososphaerota archaeon]
MLLPENKMLRLLSEVLDTEVIPSLSSPYAQAQSHAIVSTLRSMALWDEKKRKILAEENTRLKRLLTEIKTVIERSSKASSVKKAQTLVKRIGITLSNSGANTPDFENAKLVGTLDDCLLLMDELERKYSKSFTKTRTDIRRQLRKNIISEISLSAPSKMGEFSKGTG